MAAPRRSFVLKARWVFPVDAEPLPEASVVVDTLDKEITQQWMYFKTMKRVLRGLEEKIVIEDIKASGVSMHLPLKEFFPAPQGGAK